MTDTVFTEIAQRRAEILKRIDDRCQQGSRVKAPTLIAVSKIQPDERIAAALAAGQTVFGENRVQEAQGRWGSRRSRLPNLQLHLIGALQTNKAKDAVGLFDVIETLDRPKLARALAKAIEGEARAPEMLIQVNTGAEPQKAGVAVGDLTSLLGEARALGLNVSGLMCIPPADDAAGPHFALLAKLARAHDLPNLSMGMSADYETAIDFGATHVRVGSGVFGERVYDS